MTTTASRKAKGRRLQNWLVGKLLELSNLEVDDIRSTSMGVSGEDILLSPAARRKIPFSFECKSRQRVGLVRDYEQAARNSGGCVPVLVVKQDRKKPLAVVDCEWLLGLLLKDSQYEQ